MNERDVQLQIAALEREIAEWRESEGQVEDRLSEINRSLTEVGR